MFNPFTVGICFNIPKLEMFIFHALSQITCLTIFTSLTCRSTNITYVDT